MEGLRLKFSFEKKDVLRLLDEAAIYTEQERQRVAEIIFSQMNKYRYLFGDGDLSIQLKKPLELCGITVQGAFPFQSPPPVAACRLDNGKSICLMDKYER